MNSFMNLQVVPGSLVGWKYEGQGLPDDVLIRLGRAGLLATVEKENVYGHTWSPSRLVIVNSDGMKVAHIHSGEYLMFAGAHLFTNEQGMTFEEAKS